MKMGRDRSHGVRDAFKTACGILSDPMRVLPLTAAMAIVDTDFTVKRPALRAHCFVVLKMFRCPTAARLTAAVCLATDGLMPCAHDHALMPTSTQFGYFIRHQIIALGLVVGWRGHRIPCRRRRIRRYSPTA